MFHHLNLRTIDLFMYPKHGIPPRDYELTYLDLISLTLNHLELLPRRISEYLPPRFAVLVCPCEPPRHLQHVSVEGEDLSRREGRVSGVTLKGGDRVLKET